MDDLEATKFEKQTFTKEDLAELFQCSPKTIDRLRQREDFPKPFKIGKNLVRWLPKPILKWAKNNSRTIK